MNSRERVLKTLKFEEPDRVPVTLAYETPEEICTRYNKKEFIGKFRQDMHHLGFKHPEASPVIRERYLKHAPESIRIDSWGIGTGSAPGRNFYKVYNPMANMTEPDELADYPFPDYSSPDAHKHLEKEVNRMHNEGYAVQGNASQTIFEIAWQLTGMQKMMMDMYVNPEFVGRLFDILMDIRIAMAKRYVEAGVDILRLGDDVGSQKDMLISPDLWRKFLKPRLARIIEEAKKVRKDIPIFYHSDGDVRKIIPELIEVGVTILNPVQPECMDPVEIKKKYGDKLTLFGTIGTQTTMPFGTPEQVKETVARMCREIGKGGGFIIAPTHSIQSEVPWENIAAFYDAVEEYGVY